MTDPRYRWFPRPKGRSVLKRERRRVQRGPQDHGDTCNARNEPHRASEVPRAIEVREERSRSARLRLFTGHNSAGRVRPLGCVIGGDILRK